MRKRIFSLIIFIAYHTTYASTLEQKIAQCLIIGVPVNPSKQQYSWMLKSIQSYQPGGIIFLGKGTIATQCSATKIFQEHSPVPLLVCQDAEWGLAMRLIDSFSFPKNNIIGAMHNTQLTHAYAAMVAQQCKQLGIHINFAPVLDVNSNPDNPIIGTRSFSEDKEIAARCGQAYIKAYEQHNIACCAKHFPGHGDTAIDSHVGLPIIEKSLQELEQVELFPFKKAIEADIPCIMVGHIMTPALDTTLPASLSPTIMHYLRASLNFHGIIISDALNMQAITALYRQPEAAAHSLKAGADMVILASDKPGLFVEKFDDVAFYETQIAEAIERVKNLLTPAEIDQKYERIMAFKHRYITTSKTDDHTITQQALEELTKQLYVDAILKSSSYTAASEQQQTIVIHEENYKNIDRELLWHANNIIITLIGKQHGFNLNNCIVEPMYEKFVHKMLREYGEKIVLIVYANQVVAQRFNAPNKIIAFEENHYTKTIINELLSNNLAERIV